MDYPHEHEHEMSHRAGLCFENLGGGNGRGDFVSFSKVVLCI